MVLTSTISQIELAIEGKVDFVKKTNPFGSGEKTDEEKDKERIESAVPNPQIAARQIMDMVKTRQAMRNRAPKKSVERRR